MLFSFSTCLQLNNAVVADDRVRCLSMWPNSQVRTWSRYLVNGYRFHTYEYGKTKSTINSGVFVKDTNGAPNGELGYYGVLNEIVELEYHNPSVLHTRVVLFKCEWFDSTLDRGVKYHKKTGIVSINRKKKYHRYDPFVLAQQAQQVYYCNYPGAKRERSDWMAVVKVQPRFFAIAEMNENEDRAPHACQVDSMNVNTVQPSPVEIPPLCVEECETMEVSTHEINVVRASLENFVDDQELDGDEDFLEEDVALEDDDYDTSEETVFFDDSNDDDDNDGDDVGYGEEEDDDNGD